MRLSTAYGGPLDLFSAGRLASRPYCSNDLSLGTRIRGVELALQYSHIQANTPFEHFRIVLDVDHDISYCADVGEWSRFDVPPPNWFALSDSGWGHVGYELAVPVAKHAKARSAPIHYLSAIEKSLTYYLSADPGYSGLICKNPLSSVWSVGGPREAPYSLAELGSEIDLTLKHKRFPVRPDVEGQAFPNTAIARNCYLFDCLRQWAYANVHSYWGGSRDVWESKVELQAWTRFNHFEGCGFGVDSRGVDHTIPLFYNEVRATARSVADWVWLHFDKRVSDARFSDRQALRALRGARKKHAAAEPAIRAAIAAILATGRLPSYRAVALIVGCSASTLCECYSDLFKGTAH